jgi:hypothetical protein
MLMMAKIAAGNAGWRCQFRCRGSRHRPGVAEFYRWATLRFEHYIR